MTFIEIINLVKRRINETEVDEQIDALVKDAVNYAYIYEIPKYDKRVANAFVPVINGLATLPEDIDSVVSISPVLINGEKRVGNVIVTSRKVTFTVLYTTVREELVNDTDTLDLSLKFKHLLCTYASYIYWQYKKKTSIANMFLEQYNMQTMRLFEEDNLGEETVYDSYGSSETEE